MYRNKAATSCLVRFYCGEHGDTQLEVLNAEARELQTRIAYNVTELLEA